MVRLIDADALKEKSRRCFVDGFHGSGIYGEMDIVLTTDISNAPTVDAVQVVPGRWVLDKAWADRHGGDLHVCGVCNDYYTREADTLFYCPRCGAKMVEIEISQQNGWKDVFVDGEWKRVDGVVREAHVERRENV